MKSSSQSVTQVLISFCRCYRNTETTEKSATERIQIKTQGRIKRSQRDIPVVSYEELEDDIDDLDQPKRFRYGVNCLLGQCNCMEEEGKQTPVI